MIAAEAARQPPPPVATPDLETQSSLLRGEWDRLRAGGKLDCIDLARYAELQRPDEGGARGDESAWLDTVRQAAVAYEMMTSRRDNIDLVKRHGRNAWLIHNAAVESALKQYEVALLEEREAVEAVNKRRRVEQTAVGERLARMEDQLTALVRSSIDVQIASQLMDYE